MREMGEIFVLFGAVFGLLTAITNIAFAIGVYVDADDLFVYGNRRTVFVGKFFWALATILGGVFIAAIYWLIHHSNLRVIQSVQQTKDNY